MLKQTEGSHAVAEAVALPIIVYNIPGRTGGDMSTDTLARLAQDRDVLRRRHVVARR